MTKVVYSPYDYFNLSPLAIKKYYELKYPKFTLCWYAYDQSQHDYVNVDFDDIKGRCYYVKFKEYNKTFEILNYLETFQLCRHDPLLIQVIEELGHKAEYNGVELKIDEIADDKYAIITDDCGLEKLITPSEIDWININNI